MIETNIHKYNIIYYIVGSLCCYIYENQINTLSLLFIFILFIIYLFMFFNVFNFANLQTFHAMERQYTTLFVKKQKKQKNYEKN